MELGKKLPFSRHSCPTANGEQLKRCSPLAFSSLFNDDFFLRYFDNTAYSSEGLITNQENIALSNYSQGGCGFLQEHGKEIQQYAIFETDAKFTIPFFVLEEIFSEKPDSDRVFIYFTNTFTKENMLHKQIILWAKDACYLIDSANENVIVMTHQEYINSTYLKRLTNLSVLLSVHERKFVCGTDGYDIKLFKHLI